MCSPMDVEKSGSESARLGGYMRGRNREPSKSTSSTEDALTGNESEFRVGTSTVGQPVAPRAHKKSKRGCKTCKVRKIKCDETHPLCDNCRVYYQGKQNRCDYGDPILPSASSPSSSRTANQRKKRQGKAKADNKTRKDDAIPSVEPMDQNIDPFLLAQSGNSSKSTSLSLAVSPNAQMMDPFHTHPKTPEPEADELLQHYFQTTVYTIFPFYPTAEINPQAEFYSPLIYTDPLLYHVTLQLSAFHLERLKGSRHKAQSKRLMAECLSLLRERVEGDGDGLSDETIASVAGLASIEHERGNVRMVQVHMRGLKRMVSMRGGLNALRQSNGMIANIVFCIFVAANEESFPDIDLHNCTPCPDWYTAVVPAFDNPYYMQFESFGVEKQYADVLRNIRILAGTYQQASDCADSAQYLSVLCHLCANMQRVMSLPPVSNVRSKEYCIAEAVRASLILHVFHLWCGRFQPDPSLMVSNARQNLKSALKPLALPGEANELLLWFACAGAVGSDTGSPERRWFGGQVAAMAVEMALKEFEDLKGVLKRIIWHELQDELDHWTLWGEIQDLM
ncbi:fungal-specific transcription factor domain-containing protein [Lophiotrema nucula]|uniref:Fungal-specific transcription factor domain-containing protein n=1 Tax=Lophiotrema nucula TaxID=690887 RepID=A0A6A5ZH24_9PLEO|nr:fungal-specific transcription factor domain-containing protein [Lophiotrema nucula]